MRIAIVGAGISGLTVAHLLHPEHEITVFEAAERVGGHTNTIAVQTDDGAWDVDTGFIVFNDRNYPNFTRLLEQLGVASQPSEMSFSVAATGHDFEYSGTPRGLFAQRANLTRPWFLRMVREYRRFSADARALLAAGDSTTSLGHFLEQRGYSQPFVDRLLVPQASAVWSADPTPDVDVPGRLPLRVLRQPRDAVAHRAPALAHDRRRLAALRRRADRPVRRSDRNVEPDRSIERDADGVDVSSAAPPGPSASTRS